MNEEKFNNVLKDARAFAVTWHGNKRWAAGVPYIKHLEAVENNVRKFCPPPGTQGVTIEIYQELRISSYLHDLVEDTAVTLAEIEEKFGPVVSTLVWAVTLERGPNRKEKFRLSYPKIKGVAFATLLKLCDRIANVEVNARDKGSIYQMYKEEQVEFRNSLYVPGRFEHAWSYLEGLFAEPSMPSKEVTKMADGILAKVQEILDEEGGQTFSPEIWALVRSNVTPLITQHLAQLGEQKKD